MIRWLTNNIGTAAFNEAAKVSFDNNTNVVDVRDLVDKSGNDISYIRNKIEEACSLLQNDKKIIICCDYGMSRSNSIAIGVIIKWQKIGFPEAVAIAQNAIDESGIKTEMLNTVYEALYGPDNKQQKEKKNILITGGSGFIGRKLKEQLEGSCEISSPSGKEINLLKDSISLYLLTKTKKIDTIIHLANPKIFTTNKSVGDTLVMLKNILDTCRTNNIKLIYLSGWEIYSGYQSLGLLANEDLAPNPKGTYGETKWLSELLIRQYAVSYGIKYQIIRSGPVYGMGGDKPKFIYNFIQKALKDEDIVTHRFINGHPGLDLLLIDDLTNAIKKSVLNDFTGDINIGSGMGISTFEIAEIICKLTKSKSKIRHVDIQEYAPNIIMDTSRAKELLLWNPVNDIRTELSKIINEFKQQSNEHQ